MSLSPDFGAHTITTTAHPEGGTAASNVATNNILPSIAVAPRSHIERGPVSTAAYATVFPLCPTADSSSLLQNRRDGDNVSIKSYASSKRDERLYEMGEQIEMTETKCNSLKAQLDTMKRMYQQQKEEQERPPQKPIKKITNASTPTNSTANTPIDNATKAPSKPLIDITPVKAETFTTTTKLLQHRPEAIAHTIVRQNSSAIGTDTTGAAVNSINHILNGITTSVNRLSQIQAEIDSTSRLNSPRTGRGRPRGRSKPRRGSAESTTHTTTHQNAAQQLTVVLQHPAQQHETQHQNTTATSTDYDSAEKPHTGLRMLAAGATGVNSVSISSRHHSRGSPPIFTKHHPVVGAGSDREPSTDIEYGEAACQVIMEPKRPRKRTKSRSSSTAVVVAPVAVVTDAGTNPSAATMAPTIGRRPSANKVVRVPSVARQTSTKLHNQSHAKQSPLRLRPTGRLADPVIAAAAAVTAVLQKSNSGHNRVKRQLKRLNNVRVPETLRSARIDTPNNLVELYHNVAAKAASDDSDDTQMRTTVTAHAQQTRTPVATAIPANVDVPPIAIDRPPSSGGRSVMMADAGDMIAIGNQLKALSPIAENGFIDSLSNRSYYHGNYAHRYELPTIASKMKQVAKSYFHQFNYKAIPFCVARSTSPSHNIGLNIQQVMSILKTRQPLNGISPTLAHNIGIAAEKLHAAPYSAMASSLSSRLIRNSQCPLLKHPFNFQQMQEWAREIPEEDIMHDYHDDMNQGTLVPTQHSDVNYNTDWSLNASKANCTCVKQSGINFQQVLNRYQGSMTSTHVGRKSARSFRTNVWHAQNMTAVPQTIPEERPSHSNVSREKNLKDVLSNLHNEFDIINKRYDELSNRVHNGDLAGNKDAMAELERIEKCLTDKEIEIKMVMSLYEEVIALKGQVRILKEKASQASVMLQRQQYQQPQPLPVSGYLNGSNTHHQVCYTPSLRGAKTRDSMAAVHLTKLLKQIQVYQQCYKNRT